VVGHGRSNMCGRKRPLRPKQRILQAKRARTKGGKRTHQSNVFLIKFSTIIVSHSPQRSECPSSEPPRNQKGLHERQGRKSELRVQTIQICDEQGPLRFQTSLSWSKAIRNHSPDQLFQFPSDRNPAKSSHAIVYLFDIDSHRICIAQIQRQ